MQQLRFGPTAWRRPARGTVRRHDVQNTTPVVDLKQLSSGMLGPSGQGPATRASTSPPRSRSPQLDGMPGSLGVGRAPGPPAPRTTAFSDLPADALGIIAHKLSEGPLAEAGRNLANASMANRALRAAVTGLDEHAGWCLTQVRKARQLASSLLSGNPNAGQARLCLPVIGFLNPQKQAQLVRTLLESANHGPNGWVYGPATFETFVPQLANLDKPLRTELATQATRYTDDYSASVAIRGLGGGLAHFDAPSIDRLLDKATRLHNETDRARALLGLNRGLVLAALSPRTNLAARPRFDGWVSWVLIDAVGP